MVLGTFKSYALPIDPMFPGFYGLRRSGGLRT